MDLIATRAFRRGSLAASEGDWFTVESDEAGDFLIKISEVARKPTADEKAARKAAADPTPADPGK